MQPVFVNGVKSAPDCKGYEFSCKSILGTSLRLPLDDIDVSLPSLGYINFNDLDGNQFSAYIEKVVGNSYKKGVCFEKRDLIIKHTKVFISDEGEMYTKNYANVINKSLYNKFPSIIESIFTPVYPSLGNFFEDYNMTLEESSYAGVALSRNFKVGPLKGRVRKLVVESDPWAKLLFFFRENVVGYLALDEYMGEAIKIPYKFAGLIPKIKEDIQDANVIKLPEIS